MPSRLNTETLARVPRVRYFSVAGPRLRRVRSRPISFSRSGSKAGTVCVPRTAMALRFFEPMTAPGPVRPACLPPSLLMLAKRTRFSPAGPMHATLRLYPRRCFTACSVCDVVRPARSDASRKSTSPSSMDSSVGESHRPVMTSASQPVFFSSVARKLDDSESPMNPVRGDLASTANLLDVVSLLPTRGLVTNISGFSGPIGSTPGRAVLVQQVGPEARAADEAPQHVLRQGLPLYAPRGQVDHQRPSVVPVHAVYPPARLEKRRSLSPSRSFGASLETKVVPFRLNV